MPVDLDLLPGGDHHDVFPNPRNRLVRDPYDLECVPMQVYRVSLGALIVKEPAIALVRLDDDRVRARIRFPVDGPMMSVVGGPEDERKATVGFWNRGGAPKYRVYR